MGKIIRVWDGTAWQEVTPAIPYTSKHSAQSTMPIAPQDGEIWLDTDGTVVDISAYTAPTLGSTSIPSGTTVTTINGLTLGSPALTGTPTAPTATAGTNTTQVATTAYVTTAISNVIDAAPGALDTLNELAAALGDDANYATTITTALSGKQAIVSGVSNTEIGYLDGVTSAIQTQINTKASTGKAIAMAIVFGG
jgi:hypothetical protein